MTMVNKSWNPVFWLAAGTGILLILLASAAVFFRFQRAALRKKSRNLILVLEEFVPNAARFYMKECGTAPNAAWI